MPRKRKEALLAKAKAMREEKCQRRDVSIRATTEEATSPMAMEESFMLPALTEHLDILSDESSEEDENYKRDLR